jgi:cytochrome c553
MLHGAMLLSDEQAGAIYESPMPSKRWGLLLLSVRALSQRLAVGLLPANAQQPPQQLSLCMVCHGRGNSKMPLVPSLAGQPKVH